MVIELGNKTLSRQEDQRFPSGKFHYSWERNGPQASRSAFLVFGLFSAICCSLCALSFLCSLLSCYVICKDRRPVVAMSPDLSNFPQRARSTYLSEFDWFSLQLTFPFNHWQNLPFNSSYPMSFQQRTDLLVHWHRSTKYTSFFHFCRCLPIQIAPWSECSARKERLTSFLIYLFS